MARQDKRDRKKSREKQRLKERARRLQSPPRSQTLQEAGRLIQRGKWSDARAVLEEYERAHAGHPMTLRMLCEVYHELRDYASYCQTCRRSLEQDPADPYLHMMLAGGCMANGRPASALRTFRRFVELQPDDPMADGAREAIAALEEVTEELLPRDVCPEDEQLELAAMHEEVMDCLANGDSSRTIRIAEQLLARWPGFKPAMNNASEACFRSSRADDAIAMARRVLQLDPDNFHALANLTRYLLLSGRTDEARQMCERLRGAVSDNEDIWVKKIETLSLFGDDEAVLDLFECARRAGCLAGETPDDALAYHLAAVASARRSNHGQARGYWRQALKISPDLDLARKNLADANLPVAERQGPWPFSLNYWIPTESLDAFGSMVEFAARKGDKALARAARRFVEKHPEFVALSPDLLDRGDPAGRSLAVEVAFLLTTPALVAALCDFGLSQRGPDSMRIEFCNRLCQEGMLSAGAHRMWIEGKWHEIELLGFEISDEPVGSDHSEQVNAWLGQGVDALRRNDGVGAESLFQKCIEQEPDSPPLLNNLAAAFIAQGKRDEALQLTRQIHERWPDYFFGRVAVANFAVADGDYERANEMLTPLRRMRKMHTSEFAALAAAYTQLMVAQMKFEAARHWLTMLKDAVPDDPNITFLERRCTVKGLVGSLIRRMMGQ